MLHDVDTSIREAIEATGRPIEEARGLPSTWYWEPEIFALERDRLFQRTWMAVCFSHEIADTGDVYPANIAGSEIVVLRGDDGAVRAFHNICRHRAAKVVTEKAQRRRTLRCAYHCWTYGLDGRLRNAPYFKGEPDGRPNGADDTGLISVRAGEWQGIVFVNLDGNAPSLEDYVRPVAERWEHHALDTLWHFTTAESPIPANWKIVMEGLLEVYHEHFIHKDLTYRLDKDGEKTWEDIFDGDVMGFRVVEPHAEDQPPSGLPSLPGIPEDGQALTEIFLLFPSVSVNVLNDHFVRTIWTFDGPKQTSWKSDWLFAAEAAKRAETKAACGEIVEFWHNVRAEDLDAVLSVQAGMESRTAFPVETRYSPFWEPILQHFHLRVAKGLQDGQ